MARILLTTTSYQDTPGPHHELLESSGAEIIRERGPLPESRMLELAGDIDAFLCGDDEITEAVIDKALPRLKVIAKYGIGVDKIAVDYATSKKIPVAFTPGVNHTTVAEHAFLLMLALSKRLVEHANWVSAGEWKRVTGYEIAGKTLGIIGLGRIGKEVAIRANAFGMTCCGYDLYWPEEFATDQKVERMESVQALLEKSDIVSLHTNLNEETRGMISKDSIPTMKDGAMLINCGRGELVVSEDVAAALESGKLAGYGTDVLDEEPPSPDHVLLKTKNCLVTPHVGSRTYESVVRQAMKATENLLMLMRGEAPHAQVNDCPPPEKLL